MKPVIECENVHWRYRRTPVLEDASFTVDPGEFLAVVGPNGAGKTTLLKVLLGLLVPQTGSVRVLGQRPRRARRRIGYVPQFAAFNRDFPVNVLQATLMGRLGLGRRWGGYRRADIDMACRALAQVGIEGLNRTPIGALSGGELQRVLIARALACEPELLLLDEATANVDFRAETSLFDQLKAIGRDKTVLVVSHDIGFVSHYVSRVICVNRTVVCHPTAELTGDAIAALYGEPQRQVHGAHLHAQGPS